MAVTIHILKRAVTVSLPVGDTTIEAVEKASKYSLLCSSHFKEGCFEEDVSHRIVGERRNVVSLNRLLIGCLTTPRRESGNFAGFLILAVCD